MTKLKSKADKEFNTERIIDWEYWYFSFSHLINLFKALTDLEFLISTVRLFHLFMQCRKKVFLKDFVLGKGGLITEVDTDIKEYFILEGKSKYEER